MKDHPIITLCGSTKFKNEFQNAEYAFTMDGYVVLSVGVYGHTRDAERLLEYDDDEMNAKKTMLDETHRRKIDLSDGIFVVNPGGYIGKSTWNEIVYASLTQKSIAFLNKTEAQAVDCVVDMYMQEAMNVASEQKETYSNSDMLPSNCEDYEPSLVGIKTDLGYVINPWPDLNLETHKTPRPFAPIFEYGKDMAEFVIKAASKKLYKTNTE